MDNIKEKKVIDILTIIDIILGVFIALPKIHFQIQIIIGAIWLIIFLTLLYHYSKDHEYINFIEYLCNNNRHRFNLLPRLRIFIHQHNILNRMNVENLDITYSIDGKAYRGSEEELYGDLNIKYKYIIKKSSNMKIFTWVYGNDYSFEAPKLKVKYGLLDENEKIQGDDMEIAAEECSCPPYMKSVIRHANIEIKKNIVQADKWGMEIELDYKKAFDFQNLKLDTIICLPMLFGEKIENINYHILLYNYDQTKEFYFFPYKIIKNKRTYECPVQQYQKNVIKNQKLHTRFDISLDLEKTKKEYAFYFRVGTSSRDIESKF